MRIIHGRNEYMATVREKIKKDQVAVLFGESGCGKTSLMAKIAMEVKKWLGERIGDGCGSVYWDNTRFI